MSHPCPLHGLSEGSIPGHGRVFRVIFPWLITLCQPVLSRRGRKWLNPPLNGTTQPADTEEEGQSPTMDRQWLRQNKKPSLGRTQKVVNVVNGITT